MKKLAILACIACACGGSKQSSTLRTESAKAEKAEKSDAKSTEADEDRPARSDRSERGDRGKRGKADGGAPLYDRLGGRPAIAAVVDEFVARLAADARIKHRFFNTDIPKLKVLLVEFVCVATGGPCKYTGLDMQTSHAGMEVVDEEFTALVEDLAGALDKLKVPAREKGELLGALGPLKPQIVTPPDRLIPVSEAAIAKATAVAARLTDDTAVEIMQAAIVAAQRGQRNYADRLFSRVEALVGPRVVAAAAVAFREGGPPRIETPLKRMPKDTPPQPRLVGSSDEDEPGVKRPASLRGSLTVDGQPLDGLGTVMLFPASGGGKKRIPKQRVVEQRDKQFLPHVLAVPPGSTVAFPNFDGIFHNVFSLSATKRFDVGLYKDGDTRELKFEKPGIVRLACNIHAQMGGYILVVDAPHYVVVDGTKEFNFRSLLPGKYRVRAWSERSVAPTESEIVIKPGVNAMTFDVKGGAEPGPSEDKFGMTRQSAKPAGGR